MGQLTEDDIRRVALVGIVSSDELFGRLVLKGGNALNLGYQVNWRGSADLDFSMASDFKPQELIVIKRILKEQLTSAFAKEDYELIDFHFASVPKDNDKPNWGGYSVKFKVANNSQALADPKREQQRLKSAPNYEIDISKHEHCEGKEIIEISDTGISVYIYTPIMILAEKIRALCQQTPEYEQIMSHHPRRRARDFYDIYMLYNHFTDIDLTASIHHQTITAIFIAKEVPLFLLKRIGDEDQREFHEQDFLSVQNTVKQPEAANLKNFDFYFDFVKSKTKELLHPLGIE